MNRKLPLTILRAVRQVRGPTGNEGPIVVAGARELVPLVAKGLRAGGDPAAVVENASGRQAAALVWVGKADDEALRSAGRAGTPIVGLIESGRLPYVLDTNLVVAKAGQGLPIEDVAAMLAKVLGRNGPALAARLPVLRSSVLDRLIATTSGRNALIGASVFVPGADLPAMAANEVFLAARIAVARGREASPKALWPELAAVVGAGFAYRRLAHELEALPVAKFAVRAAVAFGGTWALGEALRRNPR